VTDLPDSEKKRLPCIQNPGPWQDSHNPKTQRWAARKCVTECSRLDWCEQQRQAAVQAHGVAPGVWSGRVWTHEDYRGLPASKQDIL